RRRSRPAVRACAWPKRGRRRARTAGRPFDLGGRRALVTGAGSAAGIGFASARLLARLGASVVVTSTTARIEDRAAELRAEGARCESRVADLTDRAQAFALAEAAGPVDVLVNAAGMVQ